MQSTLLPARGRARAIGGAARADSSTSPLTSIRSATTSAGRTRPRHAARVRRLRVPVLRPGGAGGARAARRLRRRALRLASPAAERRPSACAARRRGDRGGGGAGLRSGRCTTSCSPTRARCARRISCSTRRSSASTSSASSSDLRKHVRAPRVAEDVDSADLSGVSGTPTFFINGRRHHGAYDIATLKAAFGAA